MNQMIPFIPKKVPGDQKPWIRFGSTRSEYYRWIPEVCGICCLKMIGDAFDKTNRLSLYALTMRCLDRGGFKTMKSGEIQGVFHKPLLQIAREVGLEGEVKRSLIHQDMVESLQKSRFILLSIDLEKAKDGLSGSHLILIHGYDRTAGEFIIHDPSGVLNKNGCNFRISRLWLDAISNHRGLIIWNRAEKQSYGGR